MDSIVGLKGWRKENMDVFWGEIAPCDHILQIYEDDKVFLETLKGFVASGLEAGESVIIIATDEHLAALHQRLRNGDFDLSSMALKDQYIPLSAQDMLSRFMINDWPDENLFCHLLTSLLLRARKGERQVRAFGEMVALLWSQGFSGATVRLEHLWNRFCETEAFSLFCAYPKSGFTEDANESMMKICGCHSKMIANIAHTHELMVNRSTAKGSS